MIYNNYVSTMIKNANYLEEFEKEFIAGQKNDLLKNLEIYEAMWEMAKALGVFPLKDPYDGVEDDIRLAGILNRLP